MNIQLNEEAKCVKHHVTKSWCVLQNRLNFKLYLRSGHTYYLKSKFNLLHQDDDLKICDKFINDYDIMQENDEKLIGFECSYCTHKQDHPAACEHCYSLTLIPIWN